MWLPIQINGKPLKCGRVGCDSKPLQFWKPIRKEFELSGSAWNLVRFSKSLLDFWQTRGQTWLFRANLYFCYHSFYFWPTIIHVTSKVLGKEWKKLINDVSLLYWLLFWVNLMLRQLAIVPLLKSCSQNLSPITMPLLFYDSETLIFICN